MREHLDRQGRLDCLQSKRELRLSSLKTPRARAHGPEPRRGELVHREPQRVVEKRIHRLVQNRQRQLRGAGRPKFTQRAHRFEPHPGIRVGHQCRQRRERRGHRQHPHAGRPNPRITDHDEFRDERCDRQVERLMRPQRLHPRRGYGLLRRPRGQVRLHALGAAFHEDPLRLRLIVAILREQPVEQRRVIQFPEISPGQRRTPLGRDTPDAAVLLVAPRIAKIHFTVLDDRVAPIGEI